MSCLTNLGSWGSNYQCIGDICIGDMSIGGEEVIVGMSGPLIDKRYKI